MRIPTPHARQWSGAFNVVMATGIVSIATGSAGLDGVSDALAVITIIAFVPLAVADAGRARHPITMLHQARQPGRAFPALGFVAAACVLGTRVITPGGLRRTIAIVLLVVGAVVWLAIASQLGRYPGRIIAMRARAEWLLATVATEGLAILLAHSSSALHWLAVVLWALGGVFYVVIMALLARRLRSASVRPHEFTPDFWIIMGAPAIFALAAASLDHGGAATPIGAVGLAAWSLASLAIPVLAAAEVWRANALRLRFTPARWTMVFPLGMYSAASQLGGWSLHLGWMHDLGRGWVVVALAAWAAVAAGEVRYAFRPRR